MKLRFGRCYLAMAVTLISACLPGCVLFRTHPTNEDLAEFLKSHRGQLEELLTMLSEDITVGQINRKGEVVPSSLELLGVEQLITESRIDSYRSRLRGLDSVHRVVAWRDDSNPEVLQVVWFELSYRGFAFAGDEKGIAYCNSSATGDERGPCTAKVGQTEYKEIEPTWYVYHRKD